ncbi:transposase [Noviherbaspirillum sp. 1P10PC]|uniref:transposase n=1 Tax=Noviherbaspirillum sp. 1P10PC TaxID=3132292 RepID=UPI0039A2C5A7
MTRRHESLLQERSGQTGTSRLVLLTDQLQMPADLIALAYRYRWSIESFFRWFENGNGN